MCDIPKNKFYPKDSVQCGKCEGEGCAICDENGWLEPSTHPQGRTCANWRCKDPVEPNTIGIYCSIECTAEDFEDEHPNYEQRERKMREAISWPDALFDDI